MTVLSAVQKASLKIGVERPSVLFAGTDRTSVELQAMANSAAEMIAFDTGHEWTRLKTLATITGDGSDLGFDLPADYKKMLKKASLWPSSTPFSPYTHILDTDQWLGYQVQASPGLLGAWTLIGDQIHVREGGSSSPLSTGATLKYYYISTYYAKDSGGTPKAAFTADDDTFRLDEKLLEHAIVYKWKEDKGQDYAEHLSDYENRLFQEIGNDKGPAILVTGPARYPANVSRAYPGTLG